MRGFTRCAVAVCVCVTPAAAVAADQRSEPAVSREGTVTSIETAAPPAASDGAETSPSGLASILLTEKDDLGLSGFGPVPMTSENPGDDDYYQAPPSEVCDGPADVVADADLYAYLGDGGDYVYLDQWVSGEQIEAAAERFARGVDEFDRCVERGALDAVVVQPADVDEVRRYETPPAEDSEPYSTVVYARDSGVIMLLLLSLTRRDAYGDDQVAHLVDVALAKLAGFGGDGSDPSPSDVSSVSPATSVESNAPGPTGGVSAVDVDRLASALLSSDDLDAAPALDDLGVGWEMEEDGVWTNEIASDRRTRSGLCPQGSTFRFPASMAGVHLQRSAQVDGASGLRLGEIIMSFEQVESADAWIGAYESCVGTDWVEEGDPDEYIRVAHVDLADPDAIGFVLLYAHEQGADPAHDEGTAFVRLAPTLLVALYLTYFNADPVEPYDPSVLDAVIPIAVSNVESALR